MEKKPNVQTWLRDWKEGLSAKVVREKLTPGDEVYDNIFNTGNDSILIVFGPPGIDANHKDPDQDPKDPFFMGEVISCLGGDWDLHWDGLRFWARKGGEWLTLKAAFEIWEAGE